MAVTGVHGKVVHVKDGVGDANVMYRNLIRFRFVCVRASCVCLFAFIISYGIFVYHMLIYAFTMHVCAHVHIFVYIYDYS